MVTSFWEQLCAISPIAWIGMITGLLGVWWSIKERAIAWPAFIACYLCYIYLYRSLPVFTVMNTVFLIISAYGWFQWSRGKSESEAFGQPGRMSKKQRLIASAYIIPTIIGTTYLLKASGDETPYPFWDATAGVIALCAQWLLSRKRIECWALWIASDIIYAMVFISYRDWPTVILFTALIGLAIKGWKDWHCQISHPSST